MRTIDRGVVLPAAVVLALSCAGKGTMSRSAPGVVSRASPTGRAAASASVGPAAASASVSVDPAHIQERELNEALAAKIRANSGPVIREPAHWRGPFQATTLAGRSHQPARESVSAIALGSGWGCAELNLSGQPQRVCWLPTSVAERDRGKRAVRATRVPWLGVWPATAAERFCARVGGELKCWPALEFLKQPAADIPDPKAWRREHQATSRPRGKDMVAPSFVCTFDGDSVGCQGSDPFGVLASTPVKDEGPLGVQRALALGHHHGCIRQGLDITCWGRGDHGELGFPPSDRCEDAGQEIACSRQPRLARLQGERHGGIPMLAAGDTYTCAVTNHFVECWGTSRDGFFSAPGPARIPGLQLNGVDSLSAGPRGLCGDDIHWGARCVGAIPAPPRGVQSVVVSQGDDASACGVGDGIVCWGEAYSPLGHPGAPVRIRVDHASDPAAPVLDVKGRWDADCDIQRPCARDWAKLPSCEATSVAEPWATLAPHAEMERGKLVHVTGSFVVGSVGMRMAACGRGLEGVGGGYRPPKPNAPTLCCNGRWASLGLVSDGFALLLEDMSCAGDESRACCSAPATGQAVVASGILEWKDGPGEPGWMLQDPKLCGSCRLKVGERV